MERSSNQFLMAHEVAEISISYQPKVKPSNCPIIHSSFDVYRLLLERWNKDKLEFIEEFKVLILNRSNRVLGELLLASGSTSGVIVDVKLILFTVIKSNAHGFIIAHNHPSGNLKPSEQDRRLTRKVKEAAMLMDLNMMDHLIISAEGYLSFADEGLL